MKKRNVLKHEKKECSKKVDDFLEHSYKNFLRGDLLPHVFQFTEPFA